MSMTEETKRKLREYTAQKRAKVTLAKDTTLADWLVACDYIQEELGLGLEEDNTSFFLEGNGTHQSLAYFVYCPKEMVETLKSRLPHREVKIPLPSHQHKPGQTHRNLVVFRYSTLVAILDFLGINLKSKNRLPRYYRVVTRTDYYYWTQMDYVQKQEGK